MTNNYSSSYQNSSDQSGPQELFLLNVTNDVPVEYLVVLFGYITPVSFFVTVVANIIIVLVLSRPDMRTPTNQVLLVMAVADLLTLVFPVPWYFYLFTLGNHLHHIHPSLLCYLYRYMIVALPAFFHTASIWCTLLLACQRYIYICHPSTARIWCTNKRVTRIISIIFLIAFAHQLPQFFAFNYENVIVPLAAISHAPTDTLLPASNQFEPATKVSSISKLAGKPACRVVMGSWLYDMQDTYFISYYLFRIIFVHVGPCSALVIFNLLLYNALKRAELTRARLFEKSNFHTNTALLINNGSKQLSNSNGVNNNLAGDNQHKTVHNENISRASISIEIRKSNRGLGRSSGRDANSTTFMLIVVVTVFLIVEIPLAIITAVHVTENVFGIDLVTDRILNMTITFSNFFIIISYPLNFAIYCGMSQAFRETFQQIFIRRIVENSSSSSTATTTTTTANSTPLKIVKQSPHLHSGLVSVNCSEQQENERKSISAQTNTNATNAANKSQINSNSNNNHNHYNGDNNDQLIRNGDSVVRKCSIDKQPTLTDRNGVTKLVSSSGLDSSNTSSTTINHCETML